VPMAGSYRRPGWEGGRRITRGSGDTEVLVRCTESCPESIASIEDSIHGSRQSALPLSIGQGRPHTAESRAKISAANKGKLPWNKGRGHSEETKARIREATTVAMRKRRER
jgi:hypothetical protein